MRGPDRKGVRGFSNTTDTHMVGGHGISSGRTPLLQQAVFFAAVLLGVAAGST